MDYSNKERILESRGDDIRVYTVDEIAKILRVSRTSAYRFVKSGIVKSFYVGTMLRISKQSFDEWREANGI